MTPTSLVFLGAPASGKGTQGRRLAELGGFFYLSTGGLLRAALRDSSSMGEQARPFLDRGEYVPDSIMVPMVMELLKSKVQNMILDGFPRTVAQAEALDIAFQDGGKEPPSAIFLDVPMDELRRRVQGRLECSACHWVASRGQTELCSKCGGPMLPREDDDVNRFESRFREFERLTFPLVTFYEERERLLKLEALGSPDDIHHRILSKLSLSKSHGSKI